MCQIEEEILALVKFIGERPEGSPWIQIAKTRLDLLQELLIRSETIVPRKQTLNNSIPVKNIKTGEEFQSIKDAALSYGISRMALSNDIIRTDYHIHPFRYLDKPKFI